MKVEIRDGSLTIPPYEDVTIPFSGKSSTRLDFMILPGQRYGYTTDGDYVYWRRIDYFSKWLLDVENTSTEMLELQREIASKK